jgi:opacity protein-like surface antigen
MKKFLTLLVCAAVLLPGAALAGGDDDEAIPYDDGGDDNDTVKPRKKKKRRAADETREEDDEEREGEVTLANVDDPNVGVGGDFLSGVALLDASKSGVDPRYYFGVRFTWEFGRLIPDEYLREMFFADVMWTYAASKDGTNQVNVDTHLHDFTLAPAFALRLGQSFMSFYAQLGLGFDYSYSVTQIRNADTTSNITLGGTKFLFQYGIGLRGRPAVVGDGSVRIQFRIELMRFIRGYMHDMYLGAGLGMIF